MKELSSALTQARSLIEQRFVKPYNIKLNYMCGERSQPLELKVEWDSVEKVVNSNVNEGENAVQMLEQVVLWENLKKGIMRYIAEDAFQRDLFNNRVTSVVVDFLMGEYDETDINFLQGMGLLVYQINVINGYTLKPAQIYHALKNSLSSLINHDDESGEENEDDEDVSESEDEEEDNEDNIEDEDLITGKPIEDLRRAALLPVVAEKKYLNFLFRLLSSTNPYWKPSTEQASLIKLSNAEVRRRIAATESEEKFVKTWVVNKLNKNGMKQIRVLVLTDKKFYTCKIVHDKSDKKKISLDPKHVKAYPLEAVLVIDVARFKPSAAEKKLQPFGMAIYLEKDEKETPPKTRRASVFSSTPEPIEIEKPVARVNSMSQIRRDSSASDASNGSDLAEESAEEEEVVLEEGDGGPKKKKKQKKAVKILGKITKHAKKGVNKVFSPSDQPLVSQNEDDLQPRPNTDTMRVQYVLAPGDIFQSDNQQVFLLEIAWCIYTTAAAHQGKKNLRILKPFQNYRLSKPSSNVGALIYNKLNMGEAKAK